MTMSNSPKKIKRRRLDGVLLFDKPKNVSSNQILQKVKYLFRAEKAGHAGTLDPMATGLLPICFGEATKFNHQLLNNTKSYQFTCQLGDRTDTGDAEGTIIDSKSIPTLSYNYIENILEKFMGDIQQTPPMYSALHHKGKRLYELAREGKEVEREARTIHIHSLILNHFDDHSFTATVTCSKGTYVRVLAEDIANAMETYGYLTTLRRLSIEPYRAPELVSLEMIEAEITAQHNIDHFLLPVDSALINYPILTFDEHTTDRIKKGQKIRLENELLESYYRLYDDKNNFLGLGERFQPFVIKPNRLVST